MVNSFLRMNPFLNPVFLVRIAKSYLTDVNRVWHLKKEHLEAYQNKAFRQMVRYAYTVPLHHEKYKQHGIHPNDINGIKDIQKLPFISKDDIRTHFPQGVVPKGFNPQHGFQVCSSGSTGKPIFLYYDVFGAIKSLEGFVRELRSYGGSWRKSRVMIVIDNAPGSVEHAIFSGSMLPFLKKFVSMDNIRYLHISEKPELLMQQINEFDPEFLGSDPNMLRKFAFLKNQGYGENVHPHCLFSGGAILDTYTRRYVEQAFGTHLFDTYGTTEGGPLAFECTRGGIYHVHADFVHLEFLNNENQPVSSGTPGRLVVTRLYGGGTPIIRYTGMEDIVTPIEEETSCGITTPMIHHIEGRATDLLFLPNGALMSPFILTGIPAKIMEKYNSYKIRQFQIVQHQLNDIEIFIVIDEKLRDIGVPFNELFRELQQQFTQTIGQDVSVRITETDEIQKDVRVDRVKLVISKVQHQKNVRIP